ncbi:MAG: hypothetical protein ACI4OJ_03830 [Lachnospiraceae bacterium]
MRQKKTLSFAELVLESEWIGKDLLITVQGGEKPHIGCCVLAEPRPSLRGDGAVSSTSSVLNVTGHKDEALCRYFAEKAAAAHGCTVVCTGGFHVDGITKEQIAELLEAAKTMDV